MNSYIEFNSLTPIHPDLVLSHEELLEIEKTGLPDKLANFLLAPNHSAEGVELILISIFRTLGNGAIVLQGLAVNGQVVPRNICLTETLQAHVGLDEEQKAQLIGMVQLRPEVHIPQVVLSELRELSNPMSIAT